MAVERARAPEAAHMVALPAPQAALATGVARLRALVVSMRPRQWTKNLILAAPLVFSHQLRDGTATLHVTAAIGLFCLLSAAVYLVNDVRDQTRDRLHPRKRMRPIAAGVLSARLALGCAAGLTVVSLAGSFLLNPAFSLVVACYFCLQMAYILVLKDQVILDVMCVAAGFVLRVAAGAVVIAVAVSPWLLLCTTLLALFLTLIKRRHELTSVRDAAAHRPVLANYSAALLDQMISMVTAATIASYALYTFFSEEAHGTPHLMLTIPFVVYGLLRYLYLTHQRGLGGSPEEVLIGDRPLVLDLVLWAIAVVLVLYIV